MTIMPEKQHNTSLNSNNTTALPTILQLLNNNNNPIFLANQTTLYSYISHILSKLHVFSTSSV